MRLLVAACDRDGARVCDGAEARRAIACEHVEEQRLPAAVCAHECDAVSAPHVQGEVRDERALPDPSYVRMAADLHTLILAVSDMIRGNKDTQL